jgi:hypothetical protein
MDSRSALKGNSIPFSPMSLGFGAWHTKFETMSQESPSSPTALRPMQSPSPPVFLGGTSAEARSPNQFDPPSDTADIEVRIVEAESP